MSFSKTDLPHIQWSLIAFCLSLTLGASAIWLSAEYVDHSLKDRQAAQKQLGEARNKLNAAQSDLENMSTYALEYASLVEHKIIGGEQRLDWMEGLEKLHTQNHVLDFKYTIAPQLPYTANPPIESGNFDISLSGLSLEMDLLHDGQLIKFFEALRTSMQGWFIIDHCSLERTGISNNAEISATPGLSAQLKANCVGGWVTLKNRTAP